MINFWIFICWLAHGFDISAQSICMIDVKLLSNNGTLFATTKPMKCKDLIISYSSSNETKFCTSVKAKQKHKMQCKYYVLWEKAWNKENQRENVYLVLILDIMMPRFNVLLNLLFNDNIFYQQLQ